nr:hypothetical protein [Candidatus Sigynarchaeota archaeon]
MTSSNGTPASEGESKSTPFKIKDPKQILEKSREDWKKLERGFKELKEKMEQNVFKNIEKIETLHYENMKNADAIKEKIKQDWGAFEVAVESSLDNIKAENERKTAEFIQTMESRRTAIDSQLKQWETNYQEWSSATQKNVKSTLTKWSMAGWRFYISFLIVVVPIVIIIVVLVNALK